MSSHVRLALFLLAIALGGCTQERVVSDSWDRLRDMEWHDSDRPARPVGRGPQAAAEPEGSGSWAILLDSFEGETRQRRADELVRRLQQQANLPDLWTRQFGERVYVYRGRYPDAASPQAQRDLLQTRTVQVDGFRPYHHVELTQVGESPAAGASAFDLKNHSGMYSLQVAVFDEAGGSQFRQAAEDYVAQLRAGGDEAYFFHGPLRSMVTVGLFTDADFELQDTRQVYGPRIRELQRRFPYNVANGVKIVEKFEGKVLREQPSFVVRVP